MFTVQYNKGSVSLWIRYSYRSFLIWVLKVHGFCLFVCLFVFPYHAAHCVFEYHLNLFMSPWGNGGSGDRHKKMLMFQAGTIATIIRIFVSVTGVSCFLPIFVKLWQANLASYKNGRHSGLRPSSVSLMMMMSRLLTFTHTHTHKIFMSVCELCKYLWSQVRILRGYS